MLYYLLLSYQVLYAFQCFSFWGTVARTVETYFPSVPTKPNLWKRLVQDSHEWLCRFLSPSSPITLTTAVVSLEMVGWRGLERWDIRQMQTPQLELD